MSDPQAPLTIKQQRDLKQEMKEQRRQAAARQEKVKSIVTWSIVGLVIAGVIALIIVGGNRSATGGTVPAVGDQDFIRGPKSAPVTVIEYSDFQCPACAAYFPILKGLEQKYGEKVAFVYRHYPLTTIHQYAQLAAQAATAASLQGKFWEMHDLLFERQNSWSKAGNVKQTMIDYANELKLDVAKFTTDLDSGPVKDRVSSDVNAGNAAGISSTPTFYLNGTKINNPGVNETEFSKLIDAALPK